MRKIVRVNEEYNAQDDEFQRVGEVQQEYFESPKKNKGSY